jgi:hypothetical protein
LWHIPRLYVKACPNSVQLVPFQPIAISILFHHYKELKECISDIEQIIDTTSIANDSSRNNKQIEWLRQREQEEEQELKEEMPTTLDGYCSALIFTGHVYCHFLVRYSITTFLRAPASSFRWSLFFLELWLNSALRNSYLSSFSSLPSLFSSKYSLT